MTDKDLLDLVADLRHQAATWMGEEACAKLERLIAYTLALQGKIDGIEKMRAEGYQFVRTEN